VDHRLRERDARPRRLLDASALRSPPARFWLGALACPARWSAANPVMDAIEDMLTE
jgi:hypothetical protein